MAPPSVAQTAEPLMISGTRDPISDSPRGGTPVRSPSQDASAVSLTRSPGRLEPTRRSTLPLLPKWTRKGLNLRRTPSVPPGPASAESGGRGDPKPLKRRRSSGLSTPGKSDRRWFILGNHSRESDHAKAASESGGESEKKPSWASKLLGVGSKPKKDKLDQPLSTSGASTAAISSEQSRSPVVATNENHSLSMITASPDDDTNLQTIRPGGGGENPTTADLPTTDVGSEVAMGDGSLTIQLAEPGDKEEKSRPTASPTIDVDSEQAMGDGSHTAQPVRPGGKGGKSTTAVSLTTNVDPEQAMDDGPPTIRVTEPGDTGKKSTTADLPTNVTSKRAMSNELPTIRVEPEDQGEKSTTARPPNDADSRQPMDSGLLNPGMSRESNGEQARGLDAGTGQITQNVISSLLTSGQVMAVLQDQGCQNLTLGLRDPSQYPIYRGGFGDVHSGELDSGIKVAIKTLRPYQADNIPAGKYQKRIARELYTWSKCNHLNVAKLLGFAEFRDHLAIISEWAENGTLTQYIRTHKSANRCLLSTSVCEGLAYLHEKKVVHGDLKGANVLVSSDGTPMLTDFGNASLSESTIRFTATGNHGLSFRWTAPEIMQSGPRSYAGDVYALGMTILETITGMAPFNEVEHDMHIVKIVTDKQTPKRPEEIPTQSACANTLWTLLLSCWSEPNLRLSAAQVRDLMKTITPEALARVEPLAQREGESTDG